MRAALAYHASANVIPGDNRKPADLLVVLLTARGNLHATQTGSLVVRRREELPELLQPFVVGPAVLLAALRADVLASLDEALA